jgi:hypothetical protein
LAHAQPLYLLKTEKTGFAASPAPLFNGRSAR